MQSLAAELCREITVGAWSRENREKPPAQAVRKNPNGKSGPMSNSIDWIAFGQFMQNVQSARAALGLRDYQECFFRGHADNGYQLKPSLFRDASRTWEERWKVERRSFFEFRTRARQLYSGDISDWDVLFHMQHHGVPTRLLDWTSVLGVALYFALLNFEPEKGRTPCIWMLNPYALNKANWGLPRLYSPRYLARDEGLNRSYGFAELLLGTHPRGWEKQLWQTPMAIYSIQRSERMFAQSGWFTIHGMDDRSIEEIFPGRSDILRRVDIPPAVIGAVEQFLSFAGIESRTLFPDLDGLSRSICEKFNLGKQDRGV